MALDNAVIEPIAKGYNKLPEPIKNGTSNFTSNVATLLSIPNHIFQGNLKEAIESFMKAINIKSDYAEAHNNMGNVFEDNRDLDLAIEA